MDSVRFVCRIIGRHLFEFFNNFFVAVAAPHVIEGIDVAAMPAMHAFEHRDCLRFALFQFCVLHFDTLSEVDCVAFLVRFPLSS